jgi:hypothetical protein
MSFCPFSLRHLRLLIALWYLPFVRWQIVYFKDVGVFGLSKYLIIHNSPFNRLTYSIGTEHQLVTATI